MAAALRLAPDFLLFVLVLELVFVLVWPPFTGRLVGRLLTLDASDTGVSPLTTCTTRLSIDEQLLAGVLAVGVSNQRFWLELIWLPNTESGVLLIPHEISGDVSAILFTRRVQLGPLE